MGYPGNSKGRMMAAFCYMSYISLFLDEPVLAVGTHGILDPQ